MRIVINFVSLCDYKENEIKLGSRGSATSVTTIAIKKCQLRQLFSVSPLTTECFSCVVYVKRYVRLRHHFFSTFLYVVQT